jgi:hypothetical protein
MIYREFAINMAHEYERFLFSLSGKYLMLMTPGSEVTPHMVSRFKSEAEGVRQSFLNGAKRLIDSTVGNLTSDKLEALENAFILNLDQATRNNVQSMVLRMKGGSQISLKNIINAHGAIGLLLQKKLTSMEFKITTASGRSYDAATYVKAEAKNFAYQANLYNTLEKLAKVTDLAQVVYPDFSTSTRRRRLLMFKPNQVCTIKTASSKVDVYGQPQHSIPYKERCAVVKMHIQSQETSVRADSSASRGAARELVADVVVLLGPNTKAQIDDMIIVAGNTLRIMSKHAQFNLAGSVDHFEITADVWK